MTETLIDVSPSSKEAEPQPSVEELEAARELVRQARARGVALTGPDGLIKALTKTVIETALDEETWSELQANFAFLTADEHLFSQFSNDDVCVAVVCALVARARDLGLTIEPPVDELAAAWREGWIHVSCKPSGLLVGSG